MFYVVQGLKTTLSIEPNYLDQLKDQKFILEQIVQKLEGKYFDDVGYIICINKCMNLISDEQLDALIEEDGTVKLVIKFEAIVFQLKDMDIVDVEVTKCEAQAVSAKLGPIDVIIPRDRLPQNLQFSNESFKDDDEEVIKPGTKLRVQVVKANYKHGKLRAFAHLTGDGINNICGIISDDLKL